MDSPPTLAAAEVAGFQLLAELGRGAHSRVFRARRRGAADGEPDYALKLLEPSDGSAPTAAQFRREAALLAGIAHPGLTAIHEVGESGGRAYLLMDLVPGRLLTEVLTGGPLSWQQATRLALDVVGPLCAVHRRGLVHQDLKPDNIMVQPDGAARLIDFGLAARTTGEPARVTVGTLAYAPPEQTATVARPVDRRSDLYALGVVLFECVAGRRPFVATGLGDLLREHAVAPAPDLRSLVPSAPAGLAVIVGALLAKDPDDRYRSGEALAADLARLRSAPEQPFAPVLSAPGPPDADDELLAACPGWRHDDDVLTTAAVIGVRFSADLVAAALGLQRHEVLCVLSGPVGHGMVRPGPDGRHAFVHDQTREQVLAGLDPSATEALHRRLAVTLEALLPDPARRTSEQEQTLAHHRRAAGRDVE